MKAAKDSLAIVNLSLVKDDARIAELQATLRAKEEEMLRIQARTFVYRLDSYAFFGTAERMTRRLEHGVCLDDAFSFSFLELILFVCQTDPPRHIRALQTEALAVLEEKKQFKARLRVLESQVAMSGHEAEAKAREVRALEATLRARGDQLEKAASDNMSLNYELTLAINRMYELEGERETYEKKMREQGTEREVRRQTTTTNATLFYISFCYFSFYGLWLVDDRANVRLRMINRCFEDPTYNV